MGEEGFSSDSSLLYHREHPVGDRRRPAVGAARPDDRAEPPAAAPPPQAARPVPGERGGSLARRRRRARPPAGARQRRRADLLRRSADAPSPLYRNAIGDECVYVESGQRASRRCSARSTSGRRLRADPAGDRRTAGCPDVGGRSAARLRDRGQQPHRAAQALPVAVRAAARARAVLRAGPARADRAAARRRARTSRCYVKHRGTGRRHRRHRRTSRHPPVRRGRLGRLPVPVHVQRRATSSRSPAGCTSRRRCTRCSRAANFVICNFVPRKVDYHPLAVPVPYYHSNVDSDEVMFYVGGDYEARKGSGIGQGSISLHPGGHTPRAAAGRGRARRSAWSTSTSWRSWSTPSGRSSSGEAGRRQRRRPVRLDLVRRPARVLTAPAAGPPA